MKDDFFSMLYAFRDLKVNLGLKITPEIKLTHIFYLIKTFFRAQLSQFLTEIDFLSYFMVHPLYGRARAKTSVFFTVFLLRNRDASCQKSNNNNFFSKSTRFLTNVVFSLKLPFFLTKFSEK